MAPHTASCEFCKYTSVGENQQVDCAAQGVVRSCPAVDISAANFNARKLSAEGYAVRVLDNLSTGRRENLAKILGEIEFVEGDIRDAALLAEVVQ